jgi:hypothetical protein
MLHVRVALLAVLLLICVAASTLDAAAGQFDARDFLGDRTDSRTQQQQPRDLPAHVSKAIIAPLERELRNCLAAASRLRNRDVEGLINLAGADKKGSPPKSVEEYTAECCDAWRRSLEMPFTRRGLNAPADLSAYGCTH